jgi:hypothetical protein
MSKPPRRILLAETREAINKFLQHHQISYGHVANLTGLDDSRMYRFLYAKINVGPQPDFYAALLTLGTPDRPFWPQMIQERLTALRDYYGDLGL